MRKVRGSIPRRSKKNLYMKLITTLDPNKVADTDLAGWSHRKAARAVVFDDAGNIGLLHVVNKNYYKLPGGGIDEGEDVFIALKRECREELGVDIEVGSELGQIIEYRTELKLHQESHCFMAKVKGEKGAPNFTGDEVTDGFETIWVSPNDAIEFLNLKVTSNYGGRFIIERDLCFLKEALRKI